MEQQDGRCGRPDDHGRGVGPWGRLFFVELDPKKTHRNPSKPPCFHRVMMAMIPSRFFHGSSRFLRSLIYIV